MAVGMLLPAEMKAEWSVMAVAPGVALLQFGTNFFSS